MIETGGSGGLINGTNGNIVGVSDPLLAPLGNYGGLTETMVPLPGSPAIDAGSNLLAVDASGNPLTIDQRGYPRIHNGTVDIGAVEFQPKQINGTSANDQITIEQSADHAYIDWTVGTDTGQFPTTDSEGAVVNGNGGSDVITLDYTNGNPLPNIVHLNGIFTLNGLSASNSLANTNLEIGRSTVYISYSSSPLSLIQGYLKNGYDNGAWNGTPTASTGVITSTPAANNAAHTTAIGYADSADGLIAGQPANTIELKYTLYGDTSLTASVGFNAFTRMTQHWNQTTGGTWDTGDFNYDGSVNSADFTLMTRTYNTSLGSQAVPAVSAASPAASIAQSSATPATPTPTVVMPSVHAKSATFPTFVHPASRKNPRKHR